VYVRTAAHRQSIAEGQAKRADRKGSKRVGATRRASQATVVRNWAAEYARRKEKAGGMSPSTAYSKTAARQDKRTAKMALLSAPASKPRMKDGRPTSVTVLELDGTLATYVLTQVWAYVRQP